MVETVSTMTTSLSSKMRHDLNAPLINIRGFSTELRKAIDDLEILLAELEGGSQKETLFQLRKIIEDDLRFCLDCIDSSVDDLEDWQKSNLESKIG